jgi:hypothetical protein
MHIFPWPFLCIPYVVFYQYGPGRLDRSRQIGADLSRSPDLEARSPAIGPLVPAIGPVLASLTADELRERDYLLMTGPIPGIRGTRSRFHAGLGW